MSLSDKITEMKEVELAPGIYAKLIWPGDVREFIKKLKVPIKSELEFINQHNPKSNAMKTTEKILNQILNIIDSEAGADLI